MPLDAVTITALTGELNAVLPGMRIDKIQQPGKDVFSLQLHGNGRKARLLISAGVGTARMHLTGESYESPAAPPMLCLLLRKHLLGARIMGLSQPYMERMAVLETEGTDELGRPAARRLVLEMMGRASNLILTDGEGLIIDCLRRVDPGDGSRRAVLPGLYYRLPPALTKPCFFAMSGEERERVLAAAERRSDWEKTLTGAFTGLSPLIARELCLSGEPTAAAMDALAGLVDARRFRPWMLLRDGEPFDFSFMPIAQYGAAAEGREYPTFSELLDAYYSRREKSELMRRKAKELSRAAKNALGRTERRLALQKQELSSCAGKDELKRRGDIVTANIYRLRRGARELIAEDFYEEGSPTVAVELDPLKTPQQNAAAYYRQYNKRKSAERHLTGLIEAGEREAEYLGSILDELERAETDGELASIRRELNEAGYIRGPAPSKKEREAKSKPLSFTSPAGFEILVGRSNLQNEELTFKTARRTDLWLHAQKIHGSHVIIRCEGREPDEETVMLAARLAAKHSKAAGAAPVDICPVRNLKKQPGGLPGMVLYTDYKTVLVKP